MKIIVVSNGWGVKTIGGGEYHILKIMSKWSKSNELFLIIPRSGYEISKKIFEHNYEIDFSSSENSVNSLSENILLYIRRAFKSMFIVTSEHDATISASHLFYDALPAFLISRRFKSKFIVYDHSIIKKTRVTNNGIYNFLSFLNEKLGLYLTRKADLIFTVDDATREFLLNRGYNKDKVIITFNGIENTKISKIQNNGLKFDGCFCGRLSKTKGIYDILDVWEEIAKFIPHAKFIFIGNGPEYYNLLEGIEKRGLKNNILLKGFVSENEKIKLMKSSKLFLFPSYEEAWGISVSEALSCGIPVVCYDLTAYDIYENGITKVELGAIEELKKEVIDILTNDQRRINLIKNGNRVIENFRDWDDIAEQQLKFIHDVGLK